MRHLIRLVVFVVVAAVVAETPIVFGQRQGGQGAQDGGRQGGPDGGRQGGGGRGRGGGGGGGPEAQGGERGRGRGTQPARTGTAVIRGRVSNAASGAPVRRATIQATYVAEQGDRNESRTATTDDNGGFELRTLPAGRWTLRASKNGFVQQQFGQRSAFATTDPITVADGQQFVADFRLSRGGAIGGRIVDEFGDPIAGANVSVLRLQNSAQGLRTSRTGTSVPSDDNGSYRVYGLPPGRYDVSVSDPSASRVLVAELAEQAATVLRSGANGNGQALIADARGAFAGRETTSYAPTYYPGTATLAEAQRLTLALGEEQSGINLAVVPVRAARVTGRVIGTNGAPLRAQVNLADAMGQSFSSGGGGGRGGGGGGGGGRSGGVAQDGSFTLTNVPPGTYTLNVRGPSVGTTPPEVAMMPLVVNGADIVGLNIVTGSGAAVTGTFASDSSTPLPAFRPRVTAVPTQGFAATGEANATGGFTLEGLAGVYTLRFESLPAGWAVKSITANGLDVSDAALDFRPGDRVTVRVELTDRLTRVTGTIKSDRAIRGATVLVFPDEPSKWTANSRFIRTARVTDDGQFTLSGLPPHSRYMAVAIDYIEQGEAQTPEFLQRAKTAASATFALSAGDQRVVDLPLIVR